MFTLRFMRNKILDNEKIRIGRKQGWEKLPFVLIWLVYNVDFAYLCN